MSKLVKPSYKELEARCEALAAELHAVEAIHNEAVFITDNHYEQCPPEVQKIIKSLAVMQIPAYHAFLAEVRAQAADRETEYEQLKRRFQNYCKHDGGTLYAPEGRFCSICMWPEGKCQHRRSSRADNYCMDCGEKLKDEGGAA